MKHRSIIIFITMLAFALSGCETTQTLKSTISSKVSALTGGVDEAVFAQVPEEYLGPVKKAEEESRGYETRVALAKQKTALADARLKLAGYALDLEEADAKISKIAVDLAKVGAMIEAGVGNEEENEKLLSDLRVKKAKTEAGKGQTTSKMAGIEENIRGLERDIASREASLSGRETTAPEPAAEVPGEK